MKMPKFLVTWINARSHRKGHATVRAKDAKTAKELKTQRGRINIQVVKVSEKFV